MPGVADAKGKVKDFVVWAGKGGLYSVDSVGLAFANLLHNSTHGPGCTEMNHTLKFTQTSYTTL